MGLATEAPEEPTVVLLHGYLGAAADLEPFARSLGLKGRFLFPDGRVDLASVGRRGRAWWPVDADTRRGQGPRDLSDFVPSEIDEARAYLERFLDASNVTGPLVLGGFSQGAMLACDLVLRNPTKPVLGLALLSGTMISAASWRSLFPARRGLRVFMSHGREDDDLAFHVSDSLRQELVASGWEVTWCPFAGGHEIPLLAWRAFKRWVLSLSGSSQGSAR